MYPKEGKGVNLVTIDSRKEAYVCKKCFYAYTTFAKKKEVSVTWKRENTSNYYYDDDDDFYYYFHYFYYFIFIIIIIIIIIVLW